MAMAFDKEFQVGKVFCENLHQENEQKNALNDLVTQNT